MYKDEAQVQGEEVKAVSSVQSLARFSCKTNRNLKAFHSCSFHETDPFLSCQDSCSPIFWSCKVFTKLLGELVATVRCVFLFSCRCLWPLSKFQESGKFDISGMQRGCGLSIDMLGFIHLNTSVMHNRYNPLNLTIQYSQEYIQCVAAFFLQCSNWSSWSTWSTWSCFARKQCQATSSWSAFAIFITP